MAGPPAKNQAGRIPSEEPSSPAPEVAPEASEDPEEASEDGSEEDPPTTAEGPDAPASAEEESEPPVELAQPAPEPEADLGELYYRQQVEHTGSGTGGGANDKSSQQWADAYIARNRKFGLTDWEAKSA